MGRGQGRHFGVLLTCKKVQTTPTPSQVHACSLVVLASSISGQDPVVLMHYNSVVRALGFSNDIQALTPPRCLMPVAYLPVAQPPL